MPPTKKPGPLRPKATPSKRASVDVGRTPAAEPSRVGKRGSVVIPAALRRRFGIEEGSYVIAEACEGGVLIRPALVLPIEVYTPERKAQFLLSNAIPARMNATLGPGSSNDGRKSRGWRAARFTPSNGRNESGISPSTSSRR